MLPARGDVPPFFVLIAIGIGVTIWFIQAQERRGRLERRWSDLTRKLGGSFVPGGLFECDTIRFMLEDRPALLEFRDGKNPRTRLHVSLPRDPGGTLRISRDSIAQIFISALSGRRLRIGDRLFDKTYAIRSYPEALGRRVFAPGRRQEAMMAVRRLIACSGLSIDIDATRLEVRVNELADSAEVAMALVRTGRDFLGFLYAVDLDPGIQWGELSVRMAGRCPICATTLVEPLVRCERCLAPHHEECWDYAGRCATYGCDPRSGRRVA